MKTPRIHAFTTVELMVATAVMALLMLILSQLVNHTSATWQYTTQKVEQFRSSRDAFESVTRRLSQATLNTYWEYERDCSGAPIRYVRQSELRFLAGDAATLIGNARQSSGGSDGTPPHHVTHGVFFQAPIGFSNDPEYARLKTLLNTWGYFVEFGSDHASLPPFLKNSSAPPAERFRYRLMELMQPANELSLFSYTSGRGKYKAGEPNSSLYSSFSPPGGFTGREWFTEPLSVATPAPRVHVLAENVIAMVILPKLAPQEDLTETKLAPSYRYDSTETKTDPAINPRNQLPPVVQVTLVAMDERSANRIAMGSTPPDFGLDQLFQATKANSATNYENDLKTLTDHLSEQRLSYRVFTTNVSIRGAKWSRD